MEVEGAVSEDINDLQTWTCNLARSLWTGLCEPRSEYPLADPHYDYRIALPLSEPVVQNGLVLHRVKLGDPAETHYLRSTIGLVRQKLVQFF